MCHDETVEEKTVETAQWHTRKEIDRVMQPPNNWGAFLYFKTAP